MRGCASLLGLMLLATLPGCITLGDVKQAAQEAMQRCTVESIPPGATICLNGKEVGRTPCEIAHPIAKYGRSNYSFVAQLRQHETLVRSFDDFPSYIRFELEPLPAPTPPAPPAPPCDLTDLPASPDHPSLAVLDFQLGDDVSRHVGLALADFCRETVQHSGRFILVDREHMQAILTEEDFARTFECDDTRCLIDFGRKLEARKLIHGRTTRIADTYVLTLKMLDVSTGRIEAIRNTKVVGSLEALLDHTPDTTCELLSDALHAHAPAPTAAANPEAR